MSNLTSSRDDRSLPPWLYHASPRPYTLIAAGSLLAMMANLKGLDFKSGVLMLLMGPFVYWPILLAQRSLIALLPALLANLVALRVLNYPFAGVFHAAEVLFVYGLMRRFNSSAILADLTYWALIALLAFGNLFDSFIRVDERITALFLLKCALNGVLPIGVSYLILHLGPVAQFLGVGRRPSPALRPLVIRLILVLALVPITLIVTSVVILAGKLSDRAWASNQQESVRIIAREIDDDFQAKELLIRQLASSLAASSNHGDLGNRLAESTRQLTGSFITLLVTDETGMMIASSADDKHKASPTINVADRDYFRVPRDTHQPYHSTAFRGRGFGNDIIVAISAPIVSSEGHFLGIVEGSLDVTRYGQHLAGRVKLQDIELIVADSGDRVFYASPSTGIRQFENLRFNPLYKQMDARYRSGDFGYSAMNESGHLSYYHACYARATLTGFQVISRWSPFWQLSDWMPTLWTLMQITLGITITAIFVGEILQRQVAKPLEEFAGQTTAMASRGVIGTLMSPSESKPPEIQQIYEVFNQLAVKLIRHENEWLDRNRLLDQRVWERTRELESARLSAEQANQLKTQYLNSTNHEIRSSLNAMLNLSEGLLDQTKDESMRSKLRMIAESGQHVLHVNNDILDLASIHAGQLHVHPTDFDAALLCWNVCRLFEGAAVKKNLTIRADVPPQLWINTDAQRYRQIVTNILSNAVKYSTQGEIVLRARLGSQQQLVTCVRDAGPGIPLPQQVLIFREFHRLDTQASHQNSGTGLGLSISQRLAHALGGQIELFSRPGVGTSFYLTLPVGLQVARHAQASASDLGKLRVLVVDDLPANLEVMRCFLEDRVGSLDTAENGPDALKKLAADTFDIALIDLQMPGMNGLEVVTAYRARPASDSPRCKLVALSANADGKTREKCLQGGFDGYISKPIDRDTLYQLLTSLATPSFSAPERTNSSAQLFCVQGTCAGGLSYCSVVDCNANCGLRDPSLPAPNPKI